MNNHYDSMITEEETYCILMLNNTENFIQKWDLDNLFSVTEQVENRKTTKKCFCNKSPEFLC